MVCFANVVIDPTWSANLSNLLLVVWFILLACLQDG